MPIRIVTTEDGSHSLFHEELNETYHSVQGAKGESLHVFIEEGLNYWLSQNQTEEIRILEIGLGTGLNAFLTAKFGEERKQKIYFTSLEPCPVEKEIYVNLNYHETEEEKEVFNKIHESEWEKEIGVTSNYTMYKTMTPLEGFNTSNSFHVIYFDAFPPGKQPEVWFPENLKKCFDLLEEGGILTTYCAQGQFKRNLAEAGFTLETLQGAMGKKEMVRGTKTYSNN